MKSPKLTHGKLPDYYRDHDCSQCGRELLGRGTWCDTELGVYCSTTCAELHAEEIAAAAAAR